MPSVLPFIAATVFTAGCALIHLLRAHADDVTKGLVALLLLVSSLGLVAALKPDEHSGWHPVYNQPLAQARTVPEMRATPVRPFQ